MISFMTNNTTTKQQMPENKDSSTHTSLCTLVCTTMELLLSHLNSKQKKKGSMMSSTISLPICRWWTKIVSNMRMHTWLFLFSTMPHLKYKNKGIIYFHPGLILMGYWLTCKKRQTHSVIIIIGYSTEKTATEERRY